MEFDIHPKLEAILDRLEAVTRSGSGFRARCPVHGGKSTDDLAIKAGERWINLHCFAGCDYNDIRLKLGIEWADLVLDDQPPGKRQPRRRDWRAIELESYACAVRLQHEPEVLNRLRFGRVTGYHEDLFVRDAAGEVVPAEIRDGRGWSAKALEMLCVGWDGSRLTLPVRDAKGKLHDVLRYDPWTKARKILAGRGKSRLPWPAPEYLQAEVLFLVEGEGTAISMFSVGLTAVALPGSVSRPTTSIERPGSWQGAGWHRRWAERFARFRHVVLLPDSDAPGRALMRAASYDLERIDGVNTHVIDLAPKANDGADIADYLLKKAWDGPSRKVARNLVRTLVAERAEVLVA